MTVARSARTRRCGAASLVVALCLAAAPGAAQHVPFEREVVAQLWAPADPFYRDAAETVTRCIFLNGQQGEFDGWLGWVEPLTAHETDGAHVFYLYDAVMGIGPAPSNFDIVFYAHLGGCSVDEPPAEVARFTGEHNELGVIPSDARFFLVTTTDDVLVPFVVEIYHPGACGGSPPCA